MSVQKSLRVLSKNTAISSFNFILNLAELKVHRTREVVQILRFYEQMKVNVSLNNTGVECTFCTVNTSVNTKFEIAQCNETNNQWDIFHFCPSPQGPRGH
jgi:hypothetical protein